MNWPSQIKLYIKACATYPKGVMSVPRDYSDLGLYAGMVMRHLAANCLVSVAVGVISSLLIASLNTAWVVADGSRHAVDVFCETFVSIISVLLFTCLFWPIAVPAWVLFFVRTFYLYATRSPRPPRR